MNTPVKPQRIVWLLGLLLFSLLLTAGCGRDTQTGTERPGAIDLVSSQPQSSVTAFYGAADSDLLVPLSFAINSSRDTMWIALEKLLAGPPDSFVDAVVPQGLKLKDLYFANGVVNIGLTGDIELALQDIDLQALAVTVNIELNKQEGATAHMMLSYNGQPLLEQPYEVQPLNDLSRGDGEYIYYSDSQAMYVVPVCVAIAGGGQELSEQQRITEVLEAWAAGPPKDSGVYSALPDGLELLDVQLAGHELTLDFSEELLQMGGTAQENVFFSSLLATLRSYQVDTVQILVDGQTAAFLAHGTDISRPITVPHDFASINRVVQ